MPAGSFDRTITIQQVTETRNSEGGTSEEWTEFAKVRASKRDLRGSEFFAARHVSSEATTEFRIYHHAGLNSKMRIVCDDVIYDILHIAEIGRRRGHVIIARRGID